MYWYSFKSQFKFSCACVDCYTSKCLNYFLSFEFIALAHACWTSTLVLPAARVQATFLFWALKVGFVLLAEIDATLCAQL